MTKQQQYNQYTNNGGTMTIIEWENDGRFDKAASYNIDYFINKFEAIPEHKWTTAVYIEDDSYGGINCCAFGHCGMRNLDDSFNEESAALADLAKSIGAPIVDINDGKMYAYPQPHPKARILAALYDIQKATA